MSTFKGVVKMSVIKSLVGKKVKKAIQFMGEEIIIFKLSVGDVMAVQNLAQATDMSAEEAVTAVVGSEEKELPGMEIIRLVFRKAVEGGIELDDADFLTFPMDELATATNEIMKFSGVGQTEGK